jgi:DNA modification methylase
VTAKTPPAQAPAAVDVAAPPSPPQLPGGEGEPRIEYVRLPDIRAAKRNPKKHDLIGIKASMRRYGFVAPLIENAATGLLAAGHGRKEAAQALKVETPNSPPRRVRLEADGEWSLPVIRGVSFKDDKEAEEYLLADNRLAELGGWDEDQLGPMLLEISKRGAEVMLAVGWQAEDVEEMLKRLTGERDKGDDPGPLEPPMVPVARVGDLFILGDHRLLCGSSTNPGDVNRLMGTSKATLMATDPPYGVDYTAAKAGMPVSGLGDAQERWGDIENDNLTAGQLRQFLDDVFGAAMAILAKGVGIYVWHPSGELNEVFRAALKHAKILVHRQIIWKKPGFVMTRSGMYHWAHEPCFYGWVQGNVPVWYGEKNQTSVWEVSKDAGKAVHPTQKPTELFEIPMRNHTKTGEVCYEPFSGSGTQIIAGEKLGRRVYAMEIEPRWVDAAILRWERMTGKKAVLEIPEVLKTAG